MPQPPNLLRMHKKQATKGIFYPNYHPAKTFDSKNAPHGSTYRDVGRQPIENLLQFNHFLAHAEPTHLDERLSTKLTPFAHVDFDLPPNPAKHSVSRMDAPPHAPAQRFGPRMHRSCKKKKVKGSAKRCMIQTAQRNPFDKVSSE